MTQQEPTSFGSEKGFLPVTVAIPVRNEVVGLADCIQRLGAFAAVDVIDSGSTDGTREIAESLGARVLNFVWDGKFPKKRNWYLQHHPPQTPWVLFLDADELVNEEFCAELRATLPTTSNRGFWITYDNWFLGRRLRFGTPNRKLALFRVGAGEFERIEEARWTGLDMEVHEHPVLKGAVGDVRARIDHRDDRGLVHWLNRHVSYACWEANRYWQVQAKSSLNQLTRRQRSKYRRLPHWWLLPLAYVFNDLVLRRGVLDGFAGIAHAILKGWYFLVVGLLIEEIRKSAVQRDVSLARAKPSSSAPRSCS